MSRVTYAVAEVSLEAVREDHDTLLGSSFDPSEADALRGRHPRSTAGALAAKRAVCELLAVVSPGHEIQERDVVLGHSEQGAPKVVGLERSAPIAKEIFVSVTHTRRRALGLAAFQER